MKMTTTKILVFLSLILFLGACNIPGQPVPTAAPQDPNVIFTAAAETITARLAQTDAAAPLEQPSEIPPSDTPIPTNPSEQVPTDTPLPTATNTLEPTLTSSPTNTASPTTNPTAIFTDDFSSGSNWYVFDSGDWKLFYKDESYHIYNNLLGAAIHSYRTQDYTRVGVEVDGARIDGPADGYYGVICRLSDEGDNYYALVVGDDGFYGIALMEDGEFDFLANGYDDQGIIKRGEGSTNRVRGDCIGDQLIVYANGQPLLEISDDTLTSGKIGMVAGNKLSGVGTEVRFDNFAIYQP